MKAFSMALPREIYRDVVHFPTLLVVPVPTSSSSGGAEPCWKELIILLDCCSRKPSSECLQPYRDYAKCIRGHD